MRPNAFLQTNTAMAEKLYALAREAAQLTGTETVWDLYCGIGTIGLSLARDALTVWGIEVSEESVACALENAELNGITNTAFFAGNVGQVVEELLERSGPPDVVVVDPPRAGLAGKALRHLGRLGAPRLVYVSCNPTTLAGDGKTLRDEYGYELRARHAGRHVPAHAARRSGRALRARSVRCLTPRAHLVPGTEVRPPVPGTRLASAQSPVPGTRVGRPVPGTRSPVVADRYLGVRHFVTTSCQNRAVRARAAACGTDARAGRRSRAGTRPRGTAARVARRRSRRSPSRR